MGLTILSGGFDKKLNSKDFEEKFQSIIDQINNNAPIKIIYKNKDENEIIVMFNEIRGVGE